MQEFDLHIVDRKGADNPVADNLSRLENIAYDKFRSYIVDSKVTIHTDHAAIRYLMEKMLSQCLLDGCFFCKNLIYIL